MLPGGIPDCSDDRFDCFAFVVGRNDDRNRRAVGQSRPNAEAPARRRLDDRFLVRTRLGELERTDAIHHIFEQFRFADMTSATSPISTIWNPRIIRTAEKNQGLNVPNRRARAGHPVIEKASSSQAADAEHGQPDT